MDIASIPCRPPADGRENPSHLVLMLHGYGADGLDLIDLADTFASALPGALFLSPHAPGETPFNGRQWFPLEDRSPQAIVEGAGQAALYVNALADAALQIYELAPQQLIILGFSQGAMTALHTGLRRKAPGGVIAFSGLLPGVDDLTAEAAYPPVFLAHGAQDTVVLPAFSRKARNDLRDLGVAVELLIDENIGHGISPRMLKGASRWLANI